MSQITVDQVRDTAQAVVARFGHDHRNPTVNDGDGTDSCVYTDAEGNHCIAGQILVELGKSIPAWGGLDNTGTVHQLLGGSERENTEHGFNSDAVMFLASLQETADEGGTWGTALEWTLDSDIEVDQ